MNNDAKTDMGKAARDSEAMERVLSSHKRCLQIGSFFDDFYAMLLNMPPSIKEGFSNTNMERQKKILKSGVIHPLEYFCNPGPITIH
jgi:hypothetical protein